MILTLFACTFASSALFAITIEAIIQKYPSECMMDPFDIKGRAVSPT